MQRYFSMEASGGNRFYLKGGDFHHIVRVMRMNEGAEIICVDPVGKSALCKIAEITDETVAAEIVKWIEGSSELPVHITIASGLPKGDKLEWIIQKGTELGAFQFVPFIASRSVVKWDDKKSAKKVERWQKIAREAAEQSHRTRVPEICTPVNIHQLVNESPNYDYKLIAYEEEARQGESSVLASTFSKLGEGESLLVVFGPEGGLAAEEIALLKEHGFVPCGLGPRILRTETAPLYVLSAASYHFELR
ncbi:16S rRNA (uracil(1498)-N(3))-methyltransferase [Bacillus sp. T33-2]|uniref:16S rRNA (uracil(1498)-N(3))-methyltransferase n=1 Tax=Bacillus sp. T33-2 TaxID=2054168 RepID=UPI000C7578A0|nr:16S rRNA (uracil(1498)-N(3))-methyltransferase [Bacillus sp. T33-2]PLR93812.1 16S rRNA (uracil(1498)-N(3))-methyltransferase [Bacillus sp. T33-2]